MCSSLDRPVINRVSLWCCSVPAAAELVHYNSGVLPSQQGLLIGAAGRRAALEDARALLKINLPSFPSPFSPQKVSEGNPSTPETAGS